MYFDKNNTKYWVRKMYSWENMKWCLASFSKKYSAEQDIQTINKKKKKKEERKEEAEMWSIQSHR